MTSPSKLKYPAGLLLAALVLFATDNTSAQSLTNKSAAAIHRLIEQNPAARGVSQKAIAVLVFPEIVKAGFIFGGQGGEGVLLSEAGAIAPLLLPRIAGRRANRLRAICPRTNALAAIAPLLLPTDCRPACRSSATRYYFNWTSGLYVLGSTKLVAGRSGQGPKT